ncbi:MAG: PIN domain-containing protein [Nitrospirota bacterium]
MKDIEKLAVDANPILSAIIGGRARAVFLEADHISFYTTLFNFKEVEKYIPILAAKRSLPLDDLYLALSSLPISVCDLEFYKAALKKAERLIGGRDRDDVHLLGLALKLSCPIWSNDRDFDGVGVKIYSTLALIRK